MGKRIIFLVCIIMAAAPVFAQGTEPDACLGAPPLRLVIGQEGRVTPGEPNRMRAEPSVDSVEIGQIPGGESFAVLDGPVCADGYAWWRVLYNSGGAGRSRDRAIPTGSSQSRRSCIQMRTSCSLPSAWLTAGYMWWTYAARI